MRALLCPVAFLAVLTVCSSAARTDDKKVEQAENPYYKFWSKSKPGTTVELKETTKTLVKGEAISDEEVRVIRHKLVQVTPDRVVVETVVVEGEVFGFVESAPTRHIYPAKMSKELLADLLQETGAKGTESTVKVAGKDIKATLITGTIKKGDEETAFQIWLTDAVPGGIAKRIRTTKIKGEVAAETTVEVISFK